MLDDYEVAASYFRQLAPFYAKDNWSASELLALDLYAQCLRHVEQNADYVRISMKMMAKRMRGEIAIKHQSQVNSKKPANGIQYLHRATGSLSGILNISKLLEEQVMLPMDSYFDQIDMGIHIRHSADNDGFQFPLILRSLLSESFVADSIRVQIVRTEQDQRSELWLHASNQTIEVGKSVMWLGAKVSPLCFIPRVTVAHNGYRRCFQVGTS